MVALPARACRTLSFRAPTQDRRLVRKLAYAQLEKRGLAAGSPEQTSFDCHLHPGAQDRSLVTVDVVTPGSSWTPDLAKARGIFAFPRLFHFPPGKLIIIEEQGRLVLCAGADGRLAYSQIVSTGRDLNGRAAPEIRIASMALQQQGVVSEVTGVELWGDFSLGDAQALGAQIDLPVVTRARPAPTVQAVERETSQQLLPGASRAALLDRRRKRSRWAVPVSLLILGGFLVVRQHHKLVALEQEAARIEAAVSAASGQTSQLQADMNRVRAAQERWSALRLALEPRRYPLIVLNGLTRCIPGGGVVLGRFESKISELTVTGTSRSAMEAYTYFNAVRQDQQLGVYGWSMAQPTIAADGTATFQIKGQMR